MNHYSFVNLFHHLTYSGKEKITYMSARPGKDEAEKFIKHLEKLPVKVSYKRIGDNIIKLLATGQKIRFRKMTNESSRGLSFSEIYIDDPIAK